MTWKWNVLHGLQSSYELNIYIYIHTYIYIYKYETIYIKLNFKRLASKRIEVLMNCADTRTLYLFLFRLLDII